MDDGAKAPTGPITFALMWVGIAAVVVAAAGLVAGLLADDFAATFGTVVSVGMGVAAVVIVGAVALRKS